jgi:hypothetical protein
MLIPEWLMTLPIDKPPFTVVITIVAAVGMAAIVLRSTSKKQAIALVISAVAGATIGWILAWLVSDVFDVFGLPLTLVTRIWITLATVGVCVAVVSIWRARWWRVVVAIVCIPVFVLTSAVWINVDFGAYRNVKDALGIDPYPALVFGSQTGNTAPADPHLAEDWHPPASMPTQGIIGTVDIPATVSHFSARPAEIYLPPAARVSHPPILPVIEMFSGQPGSPIDIFETARFGVFLNAYAAQHHGLAPIVVVPDQLGTPEHNPMCVDSPLGNSATYLTVDVPKWITTHLRVGSTPASWAIGGYSQGGTCSMQFGAGDSKRFGSILDISGELAPTIGASTIATGFGGSQAAYEAAKPLNLLKKNAPYPDTFAFFGVGATDTRYGPGLKMTQAAAARAGMSTELVVSPGSGHDWNTVRYVLKRAVSPMASHLGLAP